MVYLRPYQRAKPEKRQPGCAAVLTLPFWALVCSLNWGWPRASLLLKGTDPQILTFAAMLTSIALRQG